MTFNFHRRAALSMLAAGALPAFAQQWPARPIRLVLPFSAGGPGDITTRLLAQALGKQLNQTVIVDNKPGAGGIIGTDFVAKSAPDGYTLLVAGNGAISNGLLHAKLPYADTDLVPLSSTNSAPSVMVVRGDSPVHNLRELQAFARSEPNGLNFGTAGSGSTGHFVAEMVRQAFDVPVTVVHFKSGSEGITALIGGQIDVVSEAAVGVLGYVKTGKLRAIALTDDRRLPVLPDVPTTAEQGFPTIRMRHWGGLFAPRNTPPEVLQKLADAMDTALRTDAQLRAQLEANGYYTQATGGRAEFQKFLDAERQRLGRLVTQARITN